jgi:iron complex transport system substrate-binding protein
LSLSPLRSAERPRIVSLLSSATEMLFTLGLGDCVLAVSHECDWPPEVAVKPRATFSHVDSSQSSAAIDEQVKRTLAAGEPLYGIDGELLAQLRPDLIVTQAQCDVCAIRYDDVVDLVATMPSISSARIVALNPVSLDDVLGDIQRVAEAAGVRDRGLEVVAILGARIDRVRRATEPLSAAQRPRTVVVEWTEPLMLAGNWMPELVELAGGTCPLAVAGRHSECIEWEHVVAFDPEAIVVAPCGFGLERSEREAKLLKSRPHWNEIAAVGAGRVFVVDGNAYFNRSGPRLVESLEILAHLLQPARVARPPWVADAIPPWRAF